LNGGTAWKLIEPPAIAGFGDPGLSPTDRQQDGDDHRSRIPPTIG
jgi:hypothetical protein